MARGVEFKDEFAECGTRWMKHSKKDVQASVIVLRERGPALESSAPGSGDDLGVSEYEGAVNAA
jgi:hypothetical protein